METLESGFRIVAGYASDGVLKIPLTAADESGKVVLRVAKLSASSPFSYKRTKLKSAFEST